MRPRVGLKPDAFSADAEGMDATHIARHTAGLTGFDLARAYDALASELAATIGTGTLSTSELLSATATYGWLKDMQAAAAKAA